MKKINPNFILFIIKVFILSTAFIAICVVVKHCNTIRLLEQKKEQVLPIAIHHYLDDSGKKHTETTVIAVVNTASLNDIYAHLIDSISKVLHTKGKDIKSTALIGTITESSFKPSIEMVKKPLSKDSASSQELTFQNEDAKVDYKDKYLTLHGNTNKDSLWHYSVTDSLIIVTYLKRKGWFEQQLYIDASTANPNTTIKGMKAIAIDGFNPHKWGIGIQLGYGFNGERMSPMVAVGIQRSIIRF